VLRHIRSGHLVRQGSSQALSAGGTFVFVAYLSVTVLTSAFTGIAAVTYLIDHDYPKAQVDMKRLPRSWMPRLGILLAAGSLGLLAGFAVPTLGTLAAAGLVLYFVGALIAHLRVGSRQLVGWAVFFISSVAALAVSLGYHGV
jgi:hypothetical protein